MVPSSSKICVLPWLHLNVNPSGSVSHCCVNSSFIVGNLSSQSLSDIWNGEPMKLIRKQMMNGVEPFPCKSCFERERITSESVRLHKNKFFNYSLDDISVSDCIIVN